MSIHVMTFEEWCAANPEAKPIEDACESCGGSGQHDCDCGDRHDCGECDGTGKVIDDTLQQQYRRQRDADLRAAFRAGLADLLAVPDLSHKDIQRIIGGTK